MIKLGHFANVWNGRVLKLSFLKHRYWGFSTTTRKHSVNIIFHSSTSSIPVTANLRSFSGLLFTDHFSKFFFSLFVDCCLLDLSTHLLAYYRGLMGVASHREWWNMWVAPHGGISRVWEPLICTGVVAERWFGFWMCLFLFFPFFIGFFMLTFLYYNIWIIFMNVSLSYTFFIVISLQSLGYIHFLK